MNKIFDFLPEEVHASVQIGELIMHTNPSARNAAVELEPIVANDEDALKAIKSAVVEQQGTRLVVKVRDGDGRNVTMVQRSTGAAISISGGNGSIVIGNGMTVVGGKVISAGGGTVYIGSGGVRAILHVPASVAATLRTQSGMVEVHGGLAKLDAEASSGGIQALGEIQEASVEVSSGNVELGIIGVLEARASSGNIHVNAVTQRGRLRASSGNIHAHTDTADFRARASSGNVRITTASGVHLDEDDVTVSSGNRRVTRR
jgi:hypothetical protein